MAHLNRVGLDPRMVKENLTKIGTLLAVEALRCRLDEAVDERERHAELVVEEECEALAEVLLLELLHQL